MARQKTGSIITKNGKLYARIRFVDETGKKRDLWKSVSSKAEAKEKIKEPIKENENKSAKELDASRMIFNQLADFYQSEKNISKDGQCRSPYYSRTGCRIGNFSVPENFCFVLI